MEEQTDDGLPVFTKQPTKTVDGLPILKKKPIPQGSPSGVPSSNTGLNSFQSSLENTNQPLNYAPVKQESQRQQLVQEDKQGGSALSQSLKAATNAYVKANPRSELITKLQNENIEPKPNKPDRGIFQDMYESLYLPSLAQGVNDLLIKPMAGATDFIDRTIDKAYTGLTGEKTPDWMRKKGAFHDLSAAYDKQFEERDKPANIVSETAEGVVGTLPLIASMFTGQGEATLVAKTPQLFNGLTKLLATTKGLSAYKEATDKGEGYAESLVSAGKGTGEGALEGMTLNAQMLLGGALGKGVANQLAKKGLLKGGKATEALLHALSVGTVFGGTSVANNLLNGEDINTREAAKQFGMGLAFEIMPVAKGINQELSEIRDKGKINEKVLQNAAVSDAASNLNSESAIRTFLTTPTEQVKGINDNIADNHETLYANSIERGAKAYDEKNVDEKRALYAEQLILKGQGDVKLIAEKIKEDKQGFVDAINASQELTPEQKSELLDKVEILSTEKPIEAKNQNEIKRDAKIDPNKDVKANIKLAVEEVATNRKDDPKQIEVLFGQFKGKKPYSYDREVADADIPEWEKNTIMEEDVPPMLKGAFKKLYDKGYIDQIDERYFVTDEGKSYVDAIQSRLDTRKGVKSGTDMFPTDANIEQAKEKPIINEPTITDTKVTEVMPEQQLQDPTATPTEKVTETIIEPVKDIENGERGKTDNTGTVESVTEQVSPKEQVKEQTPKTTKARNATTDEITKKYGIEINLNDGKRTREVVEAEADKALKDGYDVNELIEKIRNDKHQASDTETVILAKHLGAQDTRLAEIDATLEKEGGTMPDKTFNDLSEENGKLLSSLEETATALKETGRATARGLGARRFAVQNDWSLGNMIERKRREGNNGQKLTPEQLAEVQEKYKDLKNKNEAYEQKVQELTAEIERAKAGENVGKIKREVELEKRRGIRKGTIEKLDTEIKDTIADLKKKLKQQRGTLSANPIPVEYFPDLAKLAKLYAKKGIVSVDGIRDEIFNQLKDDFEGLTKDHILEAMAGMLESKSAKDPLAATKSRIRSQIIKFRNKMVQGDFTREKRTPLKLDKEGLELRDELWKAKTEWKLGLARDALAKRTKAQKTLDVFTEVINVPRALLASTDLSAPLRQGLVQTVAHPIIASKAAVHMIKSALSGKQFDRWFYDLKESADYQQMKDSKLYIADPHKPELTAKEEQFMTNIAQKIPLVGKLVAGSERAYIGYLNKLRVDLYRQSADLLERQGKTPESNPEAYKGLASWINNSTGRGSLGMAENSAQLLSTVLFSPRLMASRINLLNPIYYKNLPPEVRMLALRDMVKFVSVGLTVLAIAKLNGAEVEDDPRSSDFGKIKVGDTRWDIWGGNTQYVRFISQMISGQTKTTSTGDIKDLTAPKTPYDKTRADITSIFIRNKLAPVPALLWNAMATKNSIGEDFDLQSDAIKSVIPLVIQDTYKAIKAEGITGGLSVGIPAALGIGVQTYDDGQKVKEVKPSDKIEYFSNDYKLNEEQLAERAKINDKYLEDNKWLISQFKKDAEESKDYKDALKKTVPKWKKTGKSMGYIKKQLETIKLNYVNSQLQRAADKYSEDEFRVKYESKNNKKELDLELATD